jgi:hypothetical protein
MLVNAKDPSTVRSSRRRMGTGDPQPSLLRTLFEFGKQPLNT